MSWQCCCGWLVVLGAEKWKNKHDEGAGNDHLHRQVNCRVVLIFPAQNVRIHAAKQIRLIFVFTIYQTRPVALVTVIIAMQISCFFEISLFLFEFEILTIAPIIEKKAEAKAIGM